MLTVPATTPTALPAVKETPTDVFFVDLSLQFLSAQSAKLLPLTTVLMLLNIRLMVMVVVRMYHAVADQAGFIHKSSRGDKVTSNFLRKVARKMMDEFLNVQNKDGLSMIQWLEKNKLFWIPGRGLRASFASHWAETRYIGLKQDTLG